VPFLESHSLRKLFLSGETEVPGFSFFSGLMSLLLPLPCGKAAVSKTAGWGFESLYSCQITKVRSSEKEGLKIVQ